MAVGSGGRFGGVTRMLSRRRRVPAPGSSNAPAGPPAGGPSAAGVVAERLAGLAQPTVAVLVDGRGSGAVKALRRLLPDARVTRVSAGGGVGAVHAQLAASGPYDAVLDRTGGPRLRRRLLKNTFWHVRPGGCYVAAEHAGALDRVLERAGRLRDDNDPPGGRNQRDLAMLGAAVERATTVGDHLLLVNRTAALAKVPEAQADRLLALRGGEDRVLHTEAGTAFTSRCSFTCNRESPAKTPRTVSAPPASLREYHGPVCLPGQVLTTGNLLLPETYRHNQRRRLVNRHTEELGRRFARVSADLEAVPTLEGTYFYLDNENRGHFGHALTEQLALLWALPLAREHAGPVKAVMGVNRRRELQPFELELFGAAGLAAEDLVLLEGPARVERLLAATPMFSMPQYVHPGIAEVWQRTGDALAARATTDPQDDRIFVSRRLAKRSCRNAAEVEDLFVRHGFTLVYPEDLSLPDQVAMFRRARVVAGFAGSGLFNICFSPDPTTVIQIGHEAYTANNEYLIASVLGHELVSVVSDLDPTEDEKRRNVRRFQSSFTVNLDREGRFLREVLAGLDG
ncbi:MAG: glycosyltransferase family 61 protein [Nocardioides sp.]